MDINYFKSTRILDGGMGQELLARGLISKGTLWSASALLDKKYHQLVIDTHLSFVNAGAEVIVAVAAVVLGIYFVRRSIKNNIT